MAEDLLGSCAEDWRGCADPATRGHAFVNVLKPWQWGAPGDGALFYSFCGVTRN